VQAVEIFFRPPEIFPDIPNMTRISIPNMTRIADGKT